MKRKRYMIVHPALTTDPYNMRGKKVLIKSWSRKNDLAIVRATGNNKKGLYELDALIGIRKFKKKQY